MHWILQFFVTSALSAFSIQMNGSFSTNLLSPGPRNSECEQRVLNSVARIEIGSRQPPHDGFKICGTDINTTYSQLNNRVGTGFLVSLNPPILMTNRHVLREALDNNIIRNSLGNNSNPCSSGKISFNFTGLNQRVGCKKVSFGFPPELKLEDGAGIIPMPDAVFIELDKTPPGANYLRMEPENKNPKQEVYSAGHPLGSDSINFNKCRITSTTTHNCDTYAGSSGSPLLSLNCRVQGMHYGANPSSEGSCDSQYVDDKKNRCRRLVKASKRCTNNFNPSSGLHGVLGMISSNQVQIKDENKPFDDYERYRFGSPVETPPTAETAEPINGE